MSKPCQYLGHSLTPLEVEIGDVATSSTRDLASHGIPRSMSWESILSSTLFHNALLFLSQHASSLLCKIHNMFEINSLQIEMGKVGICEPSTLHCRHIFSTLKAMDSCTTFWSLPVLVLKNLLQKNTCKLANESSLSKNSALEGAFRSPSFLHFVLVNLVLQFIRVPPFLLVML